MRRVFLLLVLAALVGCSKGNSAAPPAGPSEPAFSEDNPENTLTWLAAQRAALHTADDADNTAALKAVAESMKGKSINWPGKLAEAHPDTTFSLVAYSLTTDPPGPRREEARQWHHLIALKPFKPGAPIADDAPFVRSPEPGLPSGAGDWARQAKRGMGVRVTGTVAAVQLHRRSWVTGYGVRDRIVHSELGITLHIADGAVSPAP